MGCTTAYFLTRHPRFDRARHRVTLLEACTTVAVGASGKAGGLLAMWAHPDPLVALSYRLHAELAAEHGGVDRWGYREVRCGSIEARVGIDVANARKASRAGADSKALREGTDAKAEDEGENAPQKEQQKKWEKIPKLDAAAADLFAASPLPKDLDYVDPACVRTWSEMGATPAESATAQVHPYQFTNAMAELASEAGATVTTNAHVKSITPSGDGGPLVVEYEDRSAKKMITIDDATDVVVAAGPWTGTLLPRSKISGLRAHSVALEATVSPYVLFTSIQLPPEFVPAHREREGFTKRKHGGLVDPEIYARPHNEVYLCGEIDSPPLPPTADLVPHDESSCDDIAAYAAAISPVLASAPVKSKQACFLPTHTRFGREVGPLIGQTSAPHVWIASGHSCWGIQNSPATGKLVSELLLDGSATSVDVSKFDPAAFKV